MRDHRYFVSFIVVSALVMLSLFIGVVTNSMNEATFKMRFEAEVNSRVDSLRQRYDFTDANIESWQVIAYSCNPYGQSLLQL